jgi:hypothetical protein
MDILHFTPAALDAESPWESEAVKRIRLATGDGGFEIAYLSVAPEGEIAVPSANHAQLLLVLSGRLDGTFLDSFALHLSAGMGVLLHSGEACNVASATGATVLAISARRLTAYPLGINQTAEHPV